MLSLVAAAAVIAELTFVGGFEWCEALHPLTLAARAAAKLVYLRRSADGFYAWTFVSGVCAVGLTLGAAPFHFARLVHGSGASDVDFVPTEFVPPREGRDVRVVLVRSESGGT
ncbi:MAG: hypothetical protein ACTS40_01555 [Candidatus Hodgkinia cicadicola]